MHNMHINDRSSGYKLCYTIVQTAHLKTTQTWRESAYICEELNPLNMKAWFVESELQIKQLVSDLAFNRCTRSSTKIFSL